MGSVDVAATLTSRLIGTLFVERGLVSESQIRVALEIQRETGEQLGKILVDRFGLSRKELAGVVADQWAELGQSGSPEAEARSNDSWRRLGEIFVERGFVTPEQLDQALQRQRETGERVGEALVAQGAISKFELAGALAEQMSALEAEAETPVDATVVSIAPRLEEAVAAEEAPVSETDQAPPPEPETEHAAEPKPERQHLTIAPPPRVALLSPVVEAKPAFGCVAFVSTPSGYRLADLDGPAPDVGCRARPARCRRGGRAPARSVTAPGRPPDVRLPRAAAPRGRSRRSPRRLAAAVPTGRAGLEPATLGLKVPCSTS